MDRARRWLAFASSVGLGIGVLPILMAAPSTATAPAPRGGSGLIAYSDGNYIHTVHPDGTMRERVSRLGCGFSDPAWSVDGTKIAVDGCGGIWTMRADGSHARQVTKNGLDSDPSWSPNRQHLVFDRRRSIDSGSAIFRINANGTGLERLTNWTDVNYFPAWSPTGPIIAYDVVQQPGGGIHTMRPDGSGKQLLTGATPNNFDLDWSADGQQLLFSGGNGGFDIYTVNADGTDLTKLADSAESPSWSPQGTEIVFDRINKDGYAAIFRMNADGSDVTRLTRWSLSARRPDWGPRVPQCGGRSATKIGTADPDSLTGTDSADVIVGRGGDDTILGKDAADIICGNAGADTIYGNQGDDILYGNTGDDVLNGGYGVDKLLGGYGTDQLFQGRK